MSKPERGQGADVYAVRDCRDVDAAVVDVDTAGHDVDAVDLVDDDPQTNNPDGTDVAGRHDVDVASLPSLCDVDPFAVTIGVEL